jgi:Zn-finger nucleic acid-binding protein
VTCPPNCPACGAPITLRPDTEGCKCDYCHAIFFPGEEDDNVVVSAASASSGPAGAAANPAIDLACQLCNLPLAQAAIAKIPVLYCTQCNGLLVHMGVLPDLIDAQRTGDRPPAVQTPPDPGELRRTIQCPKCHRRMDTHFYAGPGNVILDSCGDCLLIWLDRGELSRMAHAPDEGDSGSSDDSKW